MALTIARCFLYAVETIVAVLLFGLTLFAQVFSDGVMAGSIGQEGSTPTTSQADQLAAITSIEPCTVDRTFSSGQFADAFAGSSNDNYLGKNVVRPVNCHFLKGLYQSHQLDSPTHVAQQMPQRPCDRATSHSQARVERTPMTSANARRRNRLQASDQIHPGLVREIRGHRAGMAQRHRKRSAATTTSTRLIQLMSTARRIGF